MTKCPFSVCSDDNLSLPTSFPGTGELSKLDPQTFSDPEILRRLTLSVSSALDEAASALNKIRSEIMGLLAAKAADVLERMWDPTAVYLNGKIFVGERWWLDYHLFLCVFDVVSRTFPICCF